MAQPQKAMGHGGPMRGIRTINVNSDGSVAPGDWVKFVPIGSQIQFFANGLPENATAVFTPALFGDSITGAQLISTNNNQNLPLSPRSGVTSEISSYMVTLGSTSLGPYCVIVGGATMPVQVDALGNLTPHNIRIPNSGLLAFNAAAQITLYATWTGGGDGPFGSSELRLNQGLNVVHCDATDCTVTLSPTRAGATPPGTVKIGSGGSSPIPHA
jgi:hypothetical protein